MNLHPNPDHSTDDESGCHDFELLISAMIDGELESRQQARLGEHLLQCASCRQVVQEFERVSQQVEALSEFRIQPAATANRWLTMGRMLPAALTAAMAICIVVMFWPSAAPVQSTQVSLEQVIEPIETLHEVSLQQERDQNVTLGMMELELRLLRIELAALQPSTASQALTAEIEKMIYRILEQQADLGTVE